MMAWLSQNWVWVLFMAAFIGMHMVGHGGHGGHGKRPGEADKDNTSPDESRSEPGSKPSGHQH